eukprot:s1723_g5.t1
MSGVVAPLNRDKASLLTRQLALAFAKQRRDQRLRPDGLLFGTLLLACEKGLHWELALELLADMERSSVPLDPISSALAIRACATRNSWDLALWVLAKCSSGGDPGPRALLAAVDAVEAGGSASPELFEELCRRAAQRQLANCYMADISRLKGDRVPEKPSEKASEKLGLTTWGEVWGMVQRECSISSVPSILSLPPRSPLPTEPATSKNGPGPGLAPPRRESRKSTIKDRRDKSLQTLRSLQGLPRDPEASTTGMELTPYQCWADSKAKAVPKWTRGAEESGDKNRGIFPRNLGLALPAPRKPGKKATFTKALSGLMVAKNMKATGALAQATAGDLLPERGFVGRCGEWCLIGLVNCQGSPKVAGPLAVMIAQEMPKALFQSPSFVEHDPAAGLTEAFGKVHILSAQELDVTLTGASMTVLLMNEKEIWVAHVGDCRCVMGVPDQSGNTRNFHISAIPLTQDHTLSQPKEFERVKAAGADVRKLVWDKTCRIFAGDSDYPSLALTRGIGHRLGHTVGVTHKPTISKLNREEMPPKSFLLLGSAGIWATFSESAAVNWVSRTFQDPQEAAMSLGTEALGRWQDPEGPRGNLPADAPESFGAFLVWPTQAPTQAEQRSFVLGPQDGRSRCHWREVKSMERSHALREMAAWGTPRDGIAWHVSPK